MKANFFARLARQILGEELGIIPLMASNFSSVFKEEKFFLEPFPFQSDAVLNDHNQERTWKQENIDSNQDFDQNSKNLFVTKNLETEKSFFPSKKQLDEEHKNNQSTKKFVPSINVSNFSPNSLLSKDSKFLKNKLKGSGNPIDELSAEVRSEKLQSTEPDYITKTEKNTSTSLTFSAVERKPDEPHLKRKIKEKSVELQESEKIEEKNLSIQSKVVVQNGNVQQKPERIKYVRSEKKLEQQQQKDHSVNNHLVEKNSVCPILYQNNYAENFKKSSTFSAEPIQSKAEKFSHSHHTIVVNIGRLRIRSRKFKNKVGALMERRLSTPSTSILSLHDYLHQRSGKQL